MKKENTPWSKTDIQELIRMAKENYTVYQIAFWLQRSNLAIRNKAQELGISLKPWN